MFYRLHRSRITTLALVLAATSAACGGAASTDVAQDIVVSDSALSALPVATITDGRLICTADGADRCPLRSAVANWLSSDRLAVWEPGRPIFVLDRENPNGRTLGSIGQRSGQYSYATAVGMLDGNVAVIDMQRSKLVRYKLDNTFVREDNIPRPDESAAPGFSFETPVLQSIAAETDSGTAHLKVQVLRSQTEVGGTTVLDIPVEWLQLKGRDALAAAPLFPALPRYAIDSDKTIIWTPADSFFVQRRSFDGKVRWTLTSDRKGVEITQGDIAALRDEIFRLTPAGILKPGDLDSMVARTGKRHPAIGGFVVEPKGRILVASAASPTRDTVDYVLLTREGRPTHRFVLTGRTHPLLFAGDSLLVHRPTEGEPWELRWLRLSLGK